MSLLPDIRMDDTRRSLQVIRAERAERRAEERAFQEVLKIRHRSMIDQLESQAVGDAIRIALDEELNLLGYGLLRANGSMAKAELVARKVEMLSLINDRRISRHFGP